MIFQARVPQKWTRVRSKSAALQKKKNALTNNEAVLASLWLRGLVTKEQITPDSKHNPLEEYPVTIRHIDYIPPATAPAEVKPQLSLNQYLRQHIAKPSELQPLEPSSLYHPPETEITKYFDYLNSLNNPVIQDTSDTLPLEQELNFHTDLEQDSQARSTNLTSTNIDYTHYT